MYLLIITHFELLDFLAHVSDVGIKLVADAVGLLGCILVLLDLLVQIVCLSLELELF